MFVYFDPKTVTLKDGRSVTLRLLAQDDFDRLHAFFLALPEEDRIFLRHDVCDPNVVRKWTEQLDFDRAIPLVAVDADEIVGDGTLHMASYGWTRHVGDVRLVTARSHRHLGLGGLIARELVALAEAKGIEKVRAQVIEDDIGALKMLEAVGFQRMATLTNMVKDKHGNERNLLVMASDVSDLGRVLEDWIQDSMVPAFRAPGGG
ncbi:MAG: GNAT family N-acetyltransferase [Planctomycetota bacterium]|jgi:L-amino acid N-acyltransferase YncA